MKTFAVHASIAAGRSQITKTDEGYVIRGVVAARSSVPMNEILYPRTVIANACRGLVGCPAPAGHPKDSAGQYITAASGPALQRHYIGAIVVNAEMAGDRLLADISVNAAQAQALPSGKDLVARLDAVYSGDDTSPISLSTAMKVVANEAGGKAGGKTYRYTATAIAFDHLAILLDQEAAATPAEGVGMIFNASDGGASFDLIRHEIDISPTDEMQRGIGWAIKGVFGVNALRGMTFEAVAAALREALGDRRGLISVSDGVVIFVDYETRSEYRQEYEITEEKRVRLIGQAEIGNVEPVFRANAKGGSVELKQKIVLALNAAGISGSNALSDDDLLAAYGELAAKPVRADLLVANAAIAAATAEKVAAEKVERDTLCAKIVANSLLKADDLSAMAMPRLRELAASAGGAAPIFAANSRSRSGGDWYDFNRLGG